MIKKRKSGSGWSSRKATWLLLGSLAIIVIFIAVYDVLNSGQEETELAREESVSQATTGETERAATPTPTAISTTPLPPGIAESLRISEESGEVIMNDSAQQAKRTAVLALQNAQYYWQGVFTIEGMTGFFSPQVARSEVIRQVDSWGAGMKNWVSYQTQDIQASSLGGTGFQVTMLMWGRPEDSIVAEGFEIIMMMESSGEKFLITEVRYLPPANITQRVDTSITYDFRQLGFVFGE